jgi:hypothetical protein
MLELRREKKIRYVGVSNFTLPQIEESNELLNGELAAVQMEYNLANRGYEADIIPYCDEMNILFLAYSPLNIGKFSYVNDTLKSIARKHNRNVHQVTLNWLTATHNVAVMPQTVNFQHIVENAQSTEFTLDKEDMDKIDYEFRYRGLKLKPSEISCETCTFGIESGLPGYKTLDEALRNEQKLSPTPLELSQEVASTKKLTKPVFVHLNGDGKYELEGGNIRYWAWVIAFGVDEKIECIDTSKGA